MWHRLTLAVQAAVLEGFLFDTSPFRQDDFAAPKVNVGWGQVADAFVVTAVVVVADEGDDCGQEFGFEEEVFEPNAVFQGLMPTFDFALCLRMHWRAANVFHALFFEVFSQIASDIRRAIVAEPARFVQNPARLPHPKPTTIKSKDSRFD